MDAEFGGSWGGGKGCGIILIVDSEPEDGRKWSIGVRFENEFQWQWHSSGSLKFERNTVAELEEQ